MRFDLKVAPIRSLLLPILKASFDARLRARVYKKMAAMTGHGIGVVTCLEYQQRQFAKRRHPAALVLRETLESINAGHRLDTALQQYIPPTEAMLIGSGLSSGNLGQALELCVQIIEARRKIVANMVQALSYPALLSLLFVILLVVLSRMVVPQLAGILDPSVWQGGARILYQVAVFVDSTPGIITFVCLGTIAFLSLATLPLLTGGFRTILDRIPPWSFYRLIIGTLWLFTLSTLLQAGVQLTHAVDDMLERAETNRWLRERLMAMRSQLNIGNDLGGALENIGFDFPDQELVDDIRIYATLPDFDQQLQSIAVQWLEESMLRISAQAKVINTACISGIIALLIGLGMAVSSLQQQLGQHVAM
jgi:type II secretory pathway component PulF